ncbi:MAG: methyltransferase domain-containing protein [Snowella sp.]|nr:methyltransferase domain-containing protein [Snowella sp.]
MQIRPFLDILPSLYDHWGTTAMQPKTAEPFREILEKVEQPTTANFLQLLTSAAEYLEPGEVICEVGCLNGANLIGVLADHPDRLAYGIDFFSTESETAERKIGVLQTNLNKFGVLEQVCFAHQNVDNFFSDLRLNTSEERFGLYVYNFEPDYRQVLMSLLLARYFLADQALIIVNNTNHAEVRQAIADFLICQPLAKVLLDWQAISNDVFGSQGLGLIAWDPKNHLEQFQAIVIQETSSKALDSTTNIILEETTKKKVLHVGCGPYNPKALPPELRTEDWQEIRLDINPGVNPDILGTITDLSAVADNSVNAVYSSHNLEHIYDYEVPLALAEFKRVLKPGGLTWLVVPDMQIAAEWVIKGDMDEQPLYISPAGPVLALWMFYGMGTAMPGMPYMAHKTGFTASSLQNRLHEAGFAELDVSRSKEYFEIHAKGYKVD